MADNIEYRFIQNVGDYFPPGYFNEDFLNKIQKAAGYTPEDMDTISAKYTKLKEKYNSYKNFIVNSRPRPKDAIKHTHDFNTLLLELLGYDTSGAYDRFISLTGNDGEVVPVRHVLTRNGKPTLFIMEMQNLITVGDSTPPGLFEQRYTDETGDEKTIRNQRYYIGQWSDVFSVPENVKIAPAVINKAVDAIFLLPQDSRPKYILMLAGNEVLLLDAEKWSRGAWLQFSLDELISQASLPKKRRYYALFHLLACKQTLADDSDTVLMDTIIEESYKNAYEVTKDLKEGVVLAVETLANEALYYMKNVAHHPFGKQNPKTGEYDVTDDSFESEVKDDCLSIVYRLLFIFYAESRPELEILPLNDEVYNHGYALEMLRDLEQTRINSQESRDGYFFDASIQTLFRLLNKGFKEGRTETGEKSFSIRKIDSPLFDNSRLHHLADVKIRNSKWQEIIRALSLSKRNGRNGRGRISYANLGINQLGSVYESLLAYRGFYAEEDYIEVYKPGKLQEGTFLVPYSRIDDFNSDEILYEEDSERPLIHPKGTFIYRLNGRDRQKSASYYTPEVLTRSTVKYTLKAIIDEVDKGKRSATDLLELKILEPAMGAAAFQNEVINQLAEAYLIHRQRDLQKRISPDKFLDELQKVKAYIATHNVYGVDLNPTAIELGKLALWLNVMHKDMETPFFAGRLALGNAVIGAWLKTYNRSDVEAITVRSSKKSKEISNSWWDKAPKKVKFHKNRVNRNPDEIYHFLLPDPKMLAVTGIKEMKEEFPENHSLMKSFIKEWKTPVSASDINTLLRLSAKVDYLLREHYQQQVSIDKHTSNKSQIWGSNDKSVADNLFGMNFNYQSKQDLYNSRFVPTSAYYRLKTVMDYWCSLWFWPIEGATSLPSLREYWGDIEAILDVQDELVKHILKQDPSDIPSSLFPEIERERHIPAPSLFEELDSKFGETIILTKEDLLRLAQDNEDKDLRIDAVRFRIIKSLSARYHFFHPMLEFIEVFWQRGGFDIIAGNPPWLKLEFDETSIISDKFPEVSIRKTTAPGVRVMLSKFMANLAMAELYHSEQLEQEASTAFMNAYQNYPLLIGQQTNLYKCVLSNCMDLVNEKGYIGILCPDGIYDDPAAQPLRREIYKRLRFHFQFQNELRLFAEVHHQTKFGEQLLGPRNSTPSFLSINNLFHPSTIDVCFEHNGEGLCGSIKDEKGNWNIHAHRNRIVRYEKKELQLLSDTFEEGLTGDCAKLVNIQAKEILNVLEKISDYNLRLTHTRNVIKAGFHETSAVDDGYITGTIQYADPNEYELIFKGPNFNIATPFAKCPRENYKHNSDYDVIDLEKINDKLPTRSLFSPATTLSEYVSAIPGFVIGHDDDGKDIYDNWIDYYKVAFRSQLNVTQERTLICAVLPCRTAHINAVISVAFRDRDDCVDMAGLAASLPMDAYVKIIGAGGLFPSRMQSFPLGVAPKYKPALYSRTLILNCLTSHYADLWADTWRPEYALETWSIDDKRLKPFSRLKPDWDMNTPLRNHFERRQALVEIDVIASMALGLSLNDLELMYRIQFPVLQQKEADTWYDANGKIVFTCSKGLTGVGVDRPVWDKIRVEAEKAIAEGRPYEYEHTIEKSELYHGQKVTYVAPFDHPDRIADYRRAWDHFSKIFNEKTTD